MNKTHYETDEPLIGQLITGRYRIQSRIGEGGMGTVYLALHEAIEKRIALKVLHREYSTNLDVVERFKQEAISASRIKHPNVIDVFDFGQLEDGSCFIAMELLEGQDLGDLLAQRGALTAEEAVRVGLQVARALGLAHSRGVIHRDLKPENVFLQRTPEDPWLVKIVDFGIAQLRSTDEQGPEETRRRRLTKTGMIFGTPEYMAPEQARGRPVDQRTDIYAAGVILYEMLTGSVPFSGESFLEVLNQHVLDPVPPMKQQKPALEASDDLAKVVAVALAKSPEDRFPTMKHLAQALLRTPEGRNLQRRLHGEGLSVDQLTDELLSGAPPAPREGVRNVQTISGLPPMDEGLASSSLTNDRTPPGHLLARPLEPRRSPLPIVFGVLTVALLGGGALAWKQLDAGGRLAPPGAARPSAPDPASPAVIPGAGPGETREASAQRGQPGPGQAEAGAIVPSEPAPPERAPTESADAGDSAAVGDAAAPGVTLHIETTPSGAIIHKGDFQVCDQSPCDLVVQPEEAVVLRASKGNMNGMARVLAQREQKVSIVLRAPQRPSSSAGSAAGQSAQATGEKKATGEKPKTCEVMVDGLKILRPCD